MVKEINDQVFSSEIGDENIPVVVDFWAPWCGPCKMLGPVMDELSKDMEGKAKFVKINVDENPASSDQFKISSIPAVLIFKNGKLVDNMVGFRPKASIMQTIEKHV